MGQMVRPAGAPAADPERNLAAAAAIQRAAGRGFAHSSGRRHDVEHDRGRGHPGSQGAPDAEIRVGLARLAKPSEIPDEDE
jgi:hypothetical protein